MGLIWLPFDLSTHFLDTSAGKRGGDPRVKQRVVTRCLS